MLGVLKILVVLSLLLLPLVRLLLLLLLESSLQPELLLPLLLHPSKAVDLIFGRVLLLLLCVQVLVESVPLRWWRRRRRQCVAARPLLRPRLRPLLMLRSRDTLPEQA